MKVAIIGASARFSSRAATGRCGRRLAAATLSGKHQRLVRGHAGEPLRGTLFLQSMTLELLTHYVARQAEALCGPHLVALAMLECGNEQQPFDGVMDGL